MTRAERDELRRRIDQAVRARVADEGEARPHAPAERGEALLSSIAALAIARGQELADRGTRGG